MGKLTFWIVGGCIGYLIAGGIGAAIADIQGTEMNLNPNALVFWLIGACVGWLIAGGTGLVVGLLVTLSISLLASLLGR